MRILIIKNNLKHSVSPYIEELKRWLKEKGFQPEFSFVDTNLELSFKSFGVFPTWKENGTYIGEEKWGLDGVKEQIREEGIVPLFKYQVVCFLYDVKNVPPNLPPWTYPSDLNGAAFCEFPFLGKPNYGWLTFNLKHEIMHAFLRLLSWKGIYFIDTLDNEYTLAQVERVWKLIEPFKKKITEEYSVQKKIWFIYDLLTFLRGLLQKVAG